MKKQGLFISFEGNEGSGKTTVAQSLRDKLEKAGYEVLITREPGGVRIAEDIRNLILNPKYKEMDPLCEALLYAAARRQHLVEKVLPALAEGKIVLCDRFIDSSLAYQGVGRDIGIDDIYEINQFAIQNVLPDKTFLLEIDFKKGLQRARKRGDFDRLEQEQDSFHQKVAKGYQIIAKRFNERIQVIDADQDVDAITDIIFEEVKKLLNE